MHGMLKGKGEMKMEKATADRKQLESVLKWGLKFKKKKDIFILTFIN